MTNKRMNKNKPKPNNRNKIEPIAAIVAILISIVSLVHTCRVDNNQTEALKEEKEALKKEKEFQKCLQEADIEFSFQHFDKAFEWYAKAVSLDSTDSTGYRKFLYKAEEQIPKSDTCNVSVKNYLNYAKGLQNTKEVNDILNKYKIEKRCGK